MVVQLTSTLYDLAMNDFTEPIFTAARLIVRLDPELFEIVAPLACRKSDSEHVRVSGRVAARSRVGDLSLSWQERIDRYCQRASRVAPCCRRPCGSTCFSRSGPRVVRYCSRLLRWSSPKRCLVRR